MHKKFLAFWVCFSFFMACSVFGFGQSWDVAPSMNYERHALGVVEHNGNIYAIGGFNGANKLEVLYSGDSHWTELAPLPVGQQGLAAALAGNKIYTFGSYGPSNICQIYDIDTDTWQAGPSVPIALYWATAETVGDKIYLIAGYQARGDGPLDTLYVLDTVSKEWTQGPSLPEIIQIPSSCVFENFIYVFNGRLRAIESGYFKYDIANKSWSTFISSPSRLGSGAGAVTAEDKIYLLGGHDGYIYEAFTNTEIFDPHSELWFEGPDMNVGRYQFRAVYLDFAKKIYVVGGRDENAESLNLVETLDTSSFQFAR